MSKSTSEVRLNVPVLVNILGPPHEFYEESLKDETESSKIAFGNVILN